MPDPTSDDAFADLFGKLPSPARRTPGSASEPASPSPASDSPEQSDAARPSETPADAAAPPAPGTRRAARQAAAQASGPVRAEPDPPRRATAHHGSATAEPAGSRELGAAASAAPTATAVSREPATIDALFEAGASADDHAADKHHARDRRKGRIAGWVIFGIVLAVLGGVTAGGVYIWNTYENQIRAFMGWEEPKDYEEGLANGEAIITVLDGDTGAQVSRTLFEAGVTKTRGAFYDYLISSGLNPTFYAGAYKLQLQMTSAAALEALEDPENKLENTAQLREGLTVAQSLPILAEATGLDVADFEKAASKPSSFGVEADTLEGWLFPATYTFTPGITASEVLQTLVDRTIASLDRAEVPVDRRQEILTTASIIEREARQQDDFYKVSRVIQNRLEDGMLLQMDSTSQYGFGQLDDGSVSTSEEAQYDDNPWNTYVHPGLPVGPIANPGDRAIDAAMHPADGPWLYFVTVNQATGETIFSETYAQHQEGVAQFQQWCADNPGQC
jgi:UPF0755 protein